MPKNRSPAPDGIPPELLSELWLVVGPILLDSIIYTLKVGSFHRDQNIALLSFKKGQGSTRVGQLSSIINFDCQSEIVCQSTCYTVGCLR